MSKKPKKQMVGTRDSETGSIVGKYIEALERIADPRNTHFAGDAQVVARAALAAAPEAPATAVVQVPRIDALWGLFNEHNTPMKTRDAVLALLVAAPEAPAQGDPLEKLTRIQEELRLYDDKPAQGEQAAQPVRDERAAFEAWANDYALTAEPNYSQATKADCWAAFRAGATFASTERQPSVPAPWREAMKVAREALNDAKTFVGAWPAGTAAIAQLDSLEGGE